MFGYSSFATPTFAGIQHEIEALEDETVFVNVLLEMQVRYINAPVGYTGKWMLINVAQENLNKSN